MYYTEHIIPIINVNYFDKGVEELIFLEITKKYIYMSSETKSGEIL